MASWRYDPYLWVHLAGLATVPLWIDLCLMGLAVGNPTLPGLELGLIVGLGMLPVLVMQLRRPFYIFSLPGISLRPAVLSADQRRILSQFRRWRVRLGALPVSVLLVWVLVKLYPLAFLARDITPFEDWGRLGGVAIAIIGFFLANLFLQVPVAVLQVLATPTPRMAAVLPYPTEAIAADFSWLGLPVDRLLPSLAHQDLTPQAEQDVETANEDVRLKHQDPERQDLELLGSNHQTSTTVEALAIDLPPEVHAAENAHLAITPVPTKTPPASGSDPELTVSPFEGLTSEQDYLLDDHLFYDPPAASHHDVAVAESLGEDAGEETDNAETDDHAEIDDSISEGSVPRHPEVDDIEEASSPGLMNHSEPWPMTADVTPEFSKGISRHP
ncbi:MAG: low-complexity tail membrane protein [Nodosilinea sp.]